MSNLTSTWGSTTEAALSQALSAEGNSATTIAAPVEETPQKTYDVKAVQVNLLEDVVQVLYDNGVYKFITYEDFLEVIRSTVRPDSVPKGDPYHLPSNCFFLELNPTSIRIAMYYPETQKNITYGNLTRLSVVPNIITSFVLTKVTGTQTYKVTSAKYLCTSRPLIEIPREFPTKNTRTHKEFGILPFTNFYDNGDMCYGSNSRVAEIKLPELRPLHSYYDLLFNTPFNNDLGIYALKSTSPFHRNYAEWFSHLAKLAKEGKPFPYNELN